MAGKSAAMMAAQLGFGAHMPEGLDKPFRFKTYVPPSLVYIFSDEDKKLLATLPAGKTKKALVKKLKLNAGPTYVPSENNSAPRGLGALRTVKKAA